MTDSTPTGTTGQGDAYDSENDPSWKPSEINERVWEAMVYIKHAQAAREAWDRLTNGRPLTTAPLGWFA